MNKRELNACLCNGDISVIDALEKIQDNSKGVLYIVDEKNKLIGSVTDGDIRRWIIKTGDIKGTVSSFCNKDVKYIKDNDTENAKFLLDKLLVRSLPIVDESGVIQDIVFDDLYESTFSYDQILKDISIIIMAGGKGTRLYPYTKILPKPLIPIKDIPIIERIMNQFCKYGADLFFIVVNYKKEMIKSYFMETKHPYDIDFIDETEPLGTAGGIRLIDANLSNPVIITNCDILIEADYEDIINYHLKNHNDMTIVSSLKNITIPYGVMDVGEQGKVLSMEEKPHLSTLINTGMYIINKKFIDWIPENSFFHMTQLAQMMIEKGMNVGMYPISERSFLDMGEFEELKKMEQRINGEI